LRAVDGVVESLRHRFLQAGRVLFVEHLGIDLHGLNLHRTVHLHGHGSPAARAGHALRRKRGAGLLQIANLFGHIHETHNEPP